MLFFGSLFLFFLVVVTLQPLIPPVELLHVGRVILVPVFLSFIALAFEFPFVLAFAFLAGFVWDALTLQVISGENGPSVEIFMGWSIILYGVLGSLMHGLRPLFIKGRWELHFLLSGLSASVIVLVEFLQITLLRMDHIKEFFLPEGLWIKILGHGVICAIAALPFYLAFTFLAKATRYDLRPEEEEGVPTR